MINAGIDAITHLTIKTTIDIKDILISMITIFSLQLTSATAFDVVVTIPLNGML